MKEAFTIPGVGEFAPHRAGRVWARNFRVWRRLALPSLVGNMIDPLIYIFALGVGIGALVGKIGEESYLQFIAPGIICINLLYVSSFEGMYSAFTRMHMQGTWDAMLNAPMNVEDVVFGEWLWAATKALINAACIMGVLAAFGLVSIPLAAAALPVLALFALTSSAMALAYNAVSRSYDFFLYYMTLYLTPMLMLSGAFFPLDALPAWMAQGVMILPMAPVVDVARDVLRGEWPDLLWLMLPVQAFYMCAGLYAAVRLTKRRLA